LISGYKPNAEIIIRKSIFEETHAKITGHNSKKDTAGKSSLFCFESIPSRHAVSVTKQQAAPLQTTKQICALEAHPIFVSNVTDNANWVTDLTDTTEKSTLDWIFYRSKRIYFSNTTKENFKNVRPHFRQRLHNKWQQDLDKQGTNKKNLASIKLHLRLTQPILS
jgi:hypothetical protein